MSESNTPNPNYEPGAHPDWPPPVKTTGVVGWVRLNLLSSPLNIVMTVVALWFLGTVIPSLIEWLLINAVWDAENRVDCWKQMTFPGDPDYLSKELPRGWVQPGGCWAFIESRMSLFVYGFYPEPERWRVKLSFLMLGIAVLAALWDKMPGRKYFLRYAMIFPFLAGWLLVGGFGLKPVETDLFGGIMLTLIIGVTGITFSLPLGIMLALGRRSKMPVVRILCVLFIEFIRGVPLIALLFVAQAMLNYFMPPGTVFDLLARVLIMVTLFSAAYKAEIVRGGLQGIPQGQYEAADALGLSYWKAHRLIILPQALKISIPSIVNSFIGLYKDTTLVLIIGMLDPLGIGKAALADANWSGLAREVYLFIAIFFFISCFSMSRYSIYLEKKLNTGH
ncbi:MAG: amino acid ABC transporter permease [SAR324 cluster bacterium]|nr:amino acid ABC transporter permease [SAR324 cluster bacterium]